MVQHFYSTHVITCQLLDYLMKPLGLDPGLRFDCLIYWSVSVHLLLPDQIEI